METVEVEMLTNTVNGGTARLAVDDGMRIIAASEGYYRMTGYSGAESLEAPFYRKGVKLVLPQDLPVIASAIENLTRDEPIQITYRIRKKDGTIAWNIPAGVLRASVDDGICVLFANHEFYRQIGYTQIEFAGKDIKNQYLCSCTG
ncbi:PAS domain-containing protein [Diplocloster modestus]|uniref:PAS domain-containing protein n=1 Tax=Diplocloster modestus TaxID=2850322 RepID=A0ABS6K8Z8_9FIRM|nr:PAS domain-containing protein [Diplocloster modestus]MBU9726999.1 PAS domain-containing protein [Diplocloster modestus]